MLVAIDKLVDNPHQPRKDYNAEHIARLAANIKSRGLLQPIRVTTNNGHYIIESGHCRVRAVKFLGQSEIEAIVVEGLTDLDLMINSLSENLQRGDLTPLEICDSFSLLLDWRSDPDPITGKRQRLTREDVSKRFGWKLKTLEGYLYLRSLTDNARAIMSNASNQGNEHNVTISHVQNTRHLDPQETEAVLTKAKKEGLTAKQTKVVSEAVHRAKDEPTKAAVLESSFQEIEQESLIVKARADRIKQEEAAKKAKREQHPREVAMYFSACSAFYETVTDAIDAAIYGKFSPESIHMLRQRHERIRGAIDELERSVADGRK